MQTKTNFKKKRTAPLCEPINPEEYTAKLSKLLDQISAQNNYSNRISVTNINNLTRLQLANAELDNLRYQMKMDQLNEVSLKNINSDLTKQILELKQQLNEAAATVVQTQWQIKQLKKRIDELEHENIKLLRQNIEDRRLRVNDIKCFTTEIYEYKLETAVKDFLASVDWKDSCLINFCRECIQSDSFKSFFPELNRRLEMERDKQQKQDEKCNRLERHVFRSLKRQSVGSQSLKKPLLVEKDTPKQVPHRRVKTLLPLSAA